MNKFLSFLAVCFVLLFIICGVYSCSPSKTAVSEPNDPPVAQKTFNPNDYPLKTTIREVIEIKNPYRIVSVYGTSRDDFQEMTSIIYDACEFYGVPVDDVLRFLDSNLGTEASTDRDNFFNVTGWEIITSAPREGDNYYRIDLYTLIKE